MDEIETAVKQLLEVEDRAAVLEALRTTGNDIYQAVFDEGHGVSYAQMNTKLKKAEREKAAVEKERDGLQADIQELKAKEPDKAEIHEQYNKQIEALEGTIEELRGETQKIKVESKRDLIQAKFQAMLAPSLNDGYEEFVVFRNADLIVPDEEGNIQILQPGKQIPYPGDEQAQLKAFATDVLKNVGPSYKRSTVREGSGTDNATGGAGGEVDTKQFFDQVRDKAQNASVGSHAIANPEAELAKRMGRALPAA